MSESQVPIAAKWHVLIVEDDAQAAASYARAVESMSGFAVTGIAANGEQALSALSGPCDLLILDLELDGMDGLTLLRRLRAQQSPVEVVAVTGHRDSGTVRSVVQLGALDYIVKPFALDRLRQALGLFLHRASALHEPVLDQPAVDRVAAAGRLAQRSLPDGLTAIGLAHVQDALRNGATAPASSAELAQRTGMARVTVRRYLEYLVTIEEASVDALPSGPGRPRKLYRAAAA